MPRASLAGACSTTIGIQAIRPGLARAHAREPLVQFPWQAPWPPESEGRPFVVVSLSTLPQGQASLMRNILVALSRLDVRALVTFGLSLDPADFVASPSVVLERLVPHAAVLPKADVLVTQCGIGTVTRPSLWCAARVCAARRRSAGQHRAC